LASVEATRPADGVFPAFTSRASVTVGNPPPGPPAIARLTPGPLSVGVDWTPPVLPPGQAVTRYALVTSPATRTTYVDGGQTTARLTGLTPGKPYRVRLYAIVGNRAGTPSDWAGPVSPLDPLARIGSAADISADTTGDVGKHGSALSGDGRYLFYVALNGSSVAPPEIFRPGGTSTYLLREDLRTGDIVLASRGPDGVTPLPVFDGSGWFTTGPAVAPTPDGTKVAFIGLITGRRTVVMHDLVARRTRVIHPDSAGDGLVGGIAISDNGSVVSYRGTGQDGATGIHVYRSVDGGPPQRLDTCVLGSGCDSIAGAEMYHGLSGDGTKVIYQEFDDPVGGGSHAHLVLWDASDGQNHDLTPSPTTYENFYQPVISPDGSTFAASFLDYDPVTGRRYDGVLVKKFGTGPPGRADLVVNTELGQGGLPAALSRDGGAMVFRFRDTPGQMQGFVYRSGAGYERLPNPGGGDWLEWGLDISDDARVVSWQRAICQSYAFCSEWPGLFPMRIG
jgi:hypothetical protein